MMPPPLHHIRSMSPRALQLRSEQRGVAKLCRRSAKPASKPPPERRGVAISKTAARSATYRRRQLSVRETRSTPAQRSERSIDRTKRRRLPRPRAPHRDSHCLPFNDGNEARSPSGMPSYIPAARRRRSGAGWPDAPARHAGRPAVLGIIRYL